MSQEVLMFQMQFVVAEDMSMSLTRYKDCPHCGATLDLTASQQEWEQVSVVGVSKTFLWQCPSCMGRVYIRDEEGELAVFVRSGSEEI